MKRKNLGIYIHIPFCKSKCPYCNFYSLTNFNNVSGYVESICEEIKKWGNKLNNTVDTVYFGGGTPSVLDSSHIIKILDTIKNHFSTNFVEVTIEINPADYKFIDFEKLRFNGVNRVSIGAQSLSDSQLKILGRRHKSNDIVSAVEYATKCGIENISMDMILCVPEQKKDDIYNFIAFCEQNNIKHISAYILKFEEGTIFYKNRNDLKIMSDEDCADFYIYTCNLMKSRGYNHYEISNFAKRGYESKHNLKYWKLDEYLGIGASAHSLVNGQRFFYKEDLEKFVNNAKINFEGAFEPENEFVMLALRTQCGIKYKEFSEIFHRSIPKAYIEKALKYKKLGLMEINEDGINLTERGFLVSNKIIYDIIYN